MKWYKLFKLEFKDILLNKVLIEKKFEGRCYF